MLFLIAVAFTGRVAFDFDRPVHVPLRYGEERRWLRPYEPPPRWGEFTDAHGLPCEPRFHADCWRR